MWTSLALAALTLAPAQTDGLTLSNDRVLFGELGAVRPDNRFLPGDLVFVSFDIDNLKANDAGVVRYSMGMEVVDKNGKAVFSQKPVDAESILPLGGTKLPARAFVLIGADIEPGNCTCKVTVTDKISKASKVLEKQFEVLPKSFALVSPSIRSDQDGAPVPFPWQGVTGQT